MKTIQFKHIEILKKEVLFFFKKVIEQNLLIIQGLKNNDIKIFKKVIEQELSINKKYGSLFKRIVYEFASINAYGKDLRIIISSSYIIYELERIADYISETSFFVIENFEFKNKILNILSNLLVKLVNDFEEIKNLFLNSKSEDIIFFLNKRKNKKENLNLLDIYINKIDTKFLNNYKIFIQLKNISRIYEHLTNICEWILFEKNFVEFKEYQKDN